MKKILFSAIIAAFPFAGSAALSISQQNAIEDIRHAADMIDATWVACMRGGDGNLYMADTYDTLSGNLSGPSDVWPYTAAIEAHCSILEALEAARELDPDLYGELHDKFTSRLSLLIDNLEYYRGSLILSSYASQRKWQPYAVPRASRKGEADVRGILNVYDDQMWLSRELIRAYRLTGNEEWLQTATHLADYAIDGWDCWRDENGVEYGGITWGPGYNSKHACSNSPLIQPLVWLSEIYSASDETFKTYFRDEENQVKSEMRLRSEYYLEFAEKIYNWQKEKLQHSSGVYWDMMGADNKIITSRGYRQHVDCGAPTGSFFSYNTGTMLAGAAELYSATGNADYRDDLTDLAKVSLNKFSKYVRKHGSYEFTTDDTAANGFNTWFNDVLLRAYVDAEPFAGNNSAETAIKSFRTNLEYAFENHNRGNMLPIHLLDGWGNETLTKGFHQYAFASEFAMIALWMIQKENVDASISLIDGSGNLDSLPDDGMIYTLTGISLGKKEKVAPTLPHGLYISAGKKIIL